MNIDQKLTAIRDVIQQDVGNRGLARDPQDNLLMACATDFAEACRSIAAHPSPHIALATGFFIPTAQPPAFETDGPLGAVFLTRALAPLGMTIQIWSEEHGSVVIKETVQKLLPPEFKNNWIVRQNCPRTPEAEWWFFKMIGTWQVTHYLALERVGPGADGACRNMRGVDITSLCGPAEFLFQNAKRAHPNSTTIGIGDGGNEIGMGKIPHGTIVKNIPNGDLIHCRVATDHLIVAGVSNWGAYGLAAGVTLLKGITLPAELFDPDREREILQAMVAAGPLVDGVTGQQTATVDGLSWGDYIKPLVEIGKIVRG